MQFSESIIISSIIFTTMSCSDRIEHDSPRPQTTSGSHDESTACTLNGEECEARAGYVIIEEQRFLNEESAPARIFTIKATASKALQGEFLEFIFSGALTSGDFDVELKDPFDGGRSTPPSLVYVLPENHPESVEVANDWRTAGNVKLKLDFENNEFELKFDPVTFTNFVERDKSFSFSEASHIRGPLQVGCYKESVYNGTADTPFCRNELSKIKVW